MALQIWPRRRSLPATLPDDPSERLQALAQARDVDGLIRLLREVVPTLRPKVARALRDLTGKDLGDQARVWERWRKHSTTATRQTWRRYLVASLHLAFVVAAVQGLLHLGQRLRRRGEADVEPSATTPPAGPGGAA
jgi:hypothetical protein